MAPEGGSDDNCEYAGPEYCLNKNRPDIAREFPGQVSDTYPRQRDQCGEEQDQGDNASRMEGSL
ncbi:MAG TPA: hypothetical protein VF753_03490 [Terriglobales bacterium]